MGIFPPKDFGPPPPQKVYEISNRIFGPPPSKSDKTPYRYMYIRNFHREVNPQKVCITQILYNFFYREVLQKNHYFRKNHYFSDFFVK